jgi:YD repeat-containing protein
LISQIILLPFTGVSTVDHKSSHISTNEIGLNKLNIGTKAQTGAFVYNYPIDIPQGRNGLQPDLSLNYNNQNEDQQNIAGHGWSFSSFYIERINKNGLDKLYNENFFYSSMSGELEVVNGNNYSAKIETGDFLNYELTKDNTWVVTDKSGTKYTFGSDTNSRQDDIDNPEHIYKWMLKEIRDTNNNYVRYEYFKDSGQIYPVGIVYTGHGSVDGIYEIILGLEKIEDSSIFYNTGFEVKTNFRVSLVDVRIKGDTVKRYNFNYITEDNDKKSLLSSITESAHKGSNVETLPATIFEYNSNNIITKINYSKGSKAYIKYKKYKNNNKATDTVYTVKSITTNDGMGNESTVYYEFENGEYYNTPQNKRFAGFGLATKIIPNGNITKQYFHQGNGGSYEYERNDTEEKINTMYREDILDNFGNLYTQTLNKFEQTSLGNSRTFVYKTETVKRNFDGNETEKSTAETYRYSTENGNITKFIEWGEVDIQTDGNFVDVFGDERIHNYTYATNGNGIYALSSEIVIDSYTNKVEESKTYYDELGFGYLSKGDPTKQEKWIKENIYKTTEKDYGIYGLVISQRDANGNITEYKYDDHNLFVENTMNALGQATTAVYDYAIGQPTRTTDTNNQVYETDYDAFGRIVRSKIPNPDNSGTLVIATEYEYTDNAMPRIVKTTNYLDDTNSVESYSYINGIDQTVQTKVEAENGYVVKDIKYNNFGLLEKESLPYFDKDKYYTKPTKDKDLYKVYTYDALKRVKTITNATGAISNDYDNWKIITTDQKGNTKQYINDGYGRSVQVVENDRNETYYNYDSKGNLSKITDSKGNVRNFLYDGLGRRVISEDLHNPADTEYSVWSYIYDNNGNLISEIDSKGNIVKYFYDSLNRQTIEDYIIGFGNEVEYIYDACVGGVGKLCVVETSNVMTNYEYNNLGQISSENIIIEGVSYKTQYKYDRQGNIISIIYPDKSEVKYIYNTAGQLEKVQQKEDGGIFRDVVTNFDYSPTGQIILQENANGTKTVNTYNANELYRLVNKKTEQTKGLLSASDDGRLSASILQDLSYTYDEVGNIIQLTEASELENSKIANYSYDDLYRLTSADISNTATDTDYIEKYTYDSIGNILTKNVKGDFISTSTFIALSSTTVDGESEAEPQRAVIIDPDASQYLLISEAEQTGLDLISDFTIEAWVNFNSLPGDGTVKYIVNKNGGMPRKAYLLGVSNNSGTIRIGMNLSENGVTNIGEDTYQEWAGAETGAWHHIACVYTAGVSVECFVDSESLTPYTENIPNSINNTMIPFAVGASSGGIGAIDANIDDMRVWNIARTQTQIADNYEAELSGDEENLMGYWRFNNDLQDLSPNGNHLSWKDDTGVYADGANLVSYDSSDTTSEEGAPAFRTKVATPYKVDQTFVYEYSGVGFANPHAITDINKKGYYYDANGNLRAYEGVILNWDYKNRLIRSIVNGSTTNYFYDHNNQRVYKDQVGLVSIYPNKFYNVENPNNTRIKNLVKKHIFVGDANIATVENGELFYHHTDHLNSSSVETDGKGYVVEVLDYYPFGTVRMDKMSLGYENDNKFAGYELDSSGLYYTGQLYYNGEIGKFAGLGEKNDI